MGNFINTKYLQTIFETPTDCSYWFGYYDHFPIDDGASKLLCNKVLFDGRSITADDEIELGWFDICNGKWNSIGKTHSFNWQQGAMLQWLPGYKQVIYNFFDGYSFKSAIFNILHKNKTVLNYPIYSVFPSGKKAFCLNYERSYWCRAYHYENIKNKKYDVKIDPDDGVFEIDLQTNKIKRVISLLDIINLDYDESFSNATHWLEHIMINKSGTKGILFHRFSFANVLDYKTRVIAFDAEGKNLKVLNGWKDKQWSHAGWLNDDEFVIYTTTQSLGRKALGAKNNNKSWLYKLCRSFYYKIGRHFLSRKIKSKIQATGSYNLYKITDSQILFNKSLAGIGEIDGHPSFTNDGMYMITDTYPDDRQYQHLYVYSLRTSKRICLCSYYAFYKNNAASCDFHPKLSADNNFVSIDSAHDKRHHVMLFKLNWKEIKNAID